jgi:hypothetical protein
MQPKEWWYVRGDTSHAYFRTKMEAEVRARVLFPDESVSQRYGRVFYTTFAD